MFSTWRVYSHVCISPHFLSSSGLFATEDEWCNFAVCFQVFRVFFFLMNYQKMPSVYMFASVKMILVLLWIENIRVVFFLLLFFCVLHFLYVDVILFFLVPTFNTVTLLTLEIAEKCIMVLKWDCVTICIILFCLQGELMFFSLQNVYYYFFFYFFF